jgi:hypothetical protein
LSWWRRAQVGGRAAHAALPGPVTAALKRFRAVQAQEKLLAGPAYGETGYVLVDELGAPQRTDWLRRRAYALMEQAKVRKVRLYDARHSALTYLATNGVPDVIVSAWAGHSDLSLAKRVYVHPAASDLQQGREAFEVRSRTSRGYVLLRAMIRFSTPVWSLHQTRGGSSGGWVPMESEWSAPPVRRLADLMWSAYGEFAREAYSAPLNPRVSGPACRNR